MIDIQVNVRPTAQDWREFKRDWRQSNSSISCAHWYGAALLAAVVLVSGSTYTSLFGFFHLPTAGFLLLLSALLIIPLALNYMELSTAAEPAEGGIFLGPHKLRFRNTGIEMSGPAYSTTISWASIRGVKQTENLVILMFDSAHGLLLPKRNLANADEVFAELSSLIQSGSAKVSRQHAENRCFAAAEHLSALSTVRVLS